MTRTALIFLGCAGVLAVTGLAWYVQQRSAVENQPTDAYIDGAQCRGCHPAQARDYQQVGMARGFAPVGDAGEIQTLEGQPFVHALSGRYYEVVRRGNRLVQRRYELDARRQPVNAMELEATHVIGSGHHARTYLHRSSSGEFIELPLTWYTDQARWGMSPGFDTKAPPDFTRTADESCLFCHNGYPQQDGALASGIDCQRCHGPGSRHTRLAAGGAPKEVLRQAIVNPARLNPERQMDTCMQCHLETTSAELPSMIRRFGRETDSYRPGEPLGDYMIHFDHAAGTGRDNKFEVVNQAYRLRKSACFAKSGNRMTCTTCHDPHRQQRGASAADWYRSKCLSCHPTVAVAGHPELARADCRTCHMSRKATQDAPNVILTDHLIERRPSRPDQAPEPGRTTKYGGSMVVYYPRDLSKQEHDLYLGAAYLTNGSDPARGIRLMEGAVDHAPPQALAVMGGGYLAVNNISAAIAKFKEAVERQPSLMKARYNLAQALERAERTAEAQAEYEELIRRFPCPADAEFAFGNLLARTERKTEAAEHYRRAAQCRPTYAEAHNNLGTLQMQSGLVREGQAELEQALRIDPAYAEAHNSLAALLGANQQIPAALEHARRASELKPDDPEMRFNLGQLLQASGEMRQAIAEYQRCLRLRPGFAAAHLRLGAALADSGRLPEAIAEFRETLRLSPNNAEARRMLDMASGMTGGR